MNKSFILIGAQQQLGKIQEMNVSNCFGVFFGGPGDAGVFLWVSGEAASYLRVFVLLSPR